MTPQAVLAATPVLAPYVQRNPDSGRRPLHKVNALQAVHRLSNAGDHDLLALAAQRVQVAAESAPDPFNLWVIVHLVLANLICHGWDPFPCRGQVQRVCKAYPSSASAQATRGRKLQCGPSEAAKAPGSGAEAPVRTPVMVGTPRLVGRGRSRHSEVRRGPTAGRRMHGCLAFEQYWAARPCGQSAPPSTSEAGLSPLGQSPRPACTEPRTRSPAGGTP